MNQPFTDWENQRAFLAVWQEGSLSAAARQLGVAQPTVRRRLEALEAALGVTLFTRSPSGLTPTAAAHELGRHAEAMAYAADAFTRAASGGSEGVTGTVRISASDVVGAEVLPPILAGLQTRHPGLAIELMLSNKAQDLLRQEADIAVRMFRPTQAAMVIRPVGRIRVGFYATPAYLAAHGAPASLEDLSRFALIGPDRDRQTLAALQAAGLPATPGDFQFRADSQLAQLAAIRAGIGIGICQSGLARRSPQLVEVLPGRLDIGLDTWIVMHEDLRRVARVRAVFDHLVEELAAYAREG